jgi:hypothetical protein
MPEVLLDVAGHPRSPATLPGFHAGRSPRNKGQRYPADPPTVREIVAVMRHSGDGLHGTRLRGLIAGNNCAPGSQLASSARRPAVLRRERTDPRTPLVARGRTSAASPRRRTSTRAPSLRAPPAPPRARSRDGARGRPADRHPTPTRTHQPRDHLDLPAGHRQRRDHRHRPRPPRPGDPRRHLTADLSGWPPRGYSPARGCPSPRWGDAVCTGAA